MEEALWKAFGPGWQVRGQGPLALDDESEPEPDVAVVPGSFRDYVAGHPSQPALVVEISESSLALDRDHKGALELHRDPGPDPASPERRRTRQS